MLDPVLQLLSLIGSNKICIYYIANYKSRMLPRHQDSTCSVMSLRLKVASFTLELSLNIHSSCKIILSYIIYLIGFVNVLGF